MFLRDCTFLSKLFGMTNDRWIWHNASYSTSISLIAGAAFLFTACALLLRPFLPAEINPLTSSSIMRLAELAALVVAVGLYVDIVTSPFKDDVSAASQYATKTDRLKWMLVSLLSMASAVGTGALLMVFG
jgi:hypothetical protein